MNKTHRTYDFETILDRSGTGSVKWEQMKSDNPNVEEGIVPFSIADMEFKNPPEITEGLKACLDEDCTGIPDSGRQLQSGCYILGKTALRMGGQAGMAHKHHWSDQCILLRYPGFAGEGEGVILMTPVYPPLPKEFVKTGESFTAVP